MNYRVTIEATLRKTLTVEASSEENAIDLANEEFDLRSDHNPEKYDQQTIDVVPVQARSSITSVTTTDFATGEILKEK
jgi:hypothetical protein